MSAEDEATDTTLHIRFRKPDGSVAVLPASHRETYERLGYKGLGYVKVQPGEHAPHEEPPTEDLVHEDNPQPESETRRRK